MLPCAGEPVSTDMPRWWLMARLDLLRINANSCWIRRRGVYQYDRRCIWVRETLSSESTRCEALGPRDMRPGGIVIPGPADAQEPGFT